MRLELLYVVNFKSGGSGCRMLLSCSPRPVKAWKPLPSWQRSNLSTLHYVYNHLLTSSFVLLTIRVIYGSASYETLRVWRYLTFASLETTASSTSGSRWWTGISALLLLLQLHSIAR